MDDRKSGGGDSLSEPQGSTLGRTELPELSECPFGADLQKYWDRLSPRERLMSLDREALYSLTIQSVARDIAMKLRGETVLDPFCGAGGNVIAFAQAGKRVLASDKNPERLALAARNADLFGVSHLISFDIGDAVKVLETCSADAVYLDPPWGGPDYWQRGAFTLRDFSPDGRELLQQALLFAREVAIKLPKNFALEELGTLNVAVRIQEDLFEGKRLGFTAFLSKDECIG